MPRRLLIDSDVFVLYAGAGVLDELIGILGYAPSDCRRLDALPHMLRKSGKYRDLAPQNRQAALDWCERIPNETVAPDAALVDRLGVPGIDEGEVQLFGIAFQDEVTYLTTGDKISLRALCANTNLKDIRDRIAGRVICLETAIQILVERLGFNEAVRRFSAVSGHKSLKVFFSPANISNPDQFHDAVRSYLEALKREVGNDFLFEPTSQPNGTGN